MSRVLLDENLPVGLRRHLTDHDVDHVTALGWHGIGNGQLIERAQRYGYDILVTADRNLRYQQNLTNRHLAIVVLSTNRWNDLRRSLDIVADAVARVRAGAFAVVEITGSNSNRPS